MLGLYYMPAYASMLLRNFSLSCTHNNEFILNALLKCVLPAYTHCILSYLKIFIHLLAVCLHFATGTGLAGVYILYNFTCTFNTKKQLLINAHMN